MLKKLWTMANLLRKFFIICTVIFMASPGFADMVVKKPAGEEMICSVWLAKPVLEHKKVKNFGKEEDRVTFKMDVTNFDMSQSGHPALPYLYYRVLIPYGFALKKIETIQDLPQKEMLSQKLNFIPQPITPDDYMNPEKRAAWENSQKEDIAIYSTSDFYKKELLTSEQKIYRGYHVVEFKINPFQYNPVTGELRYHQHMDLKLTLEKSAETQNISDRFIRNKENDINFVKDIVVNREELESYQPAIHKKLSLTAAQKEENKK